jgi:hypothetical protein
MTIECFEGDPGQGKTYHLAKLGIKKMKKGHPVYANFPLENCIPYSQLSELFEIRFERTSRKDKNPIILMDEASLICPAAMWNVIPHEVLTHWRMHRHSGLDIYYTAQDYTDVAKGLRGVTQFVTRVSKFGPLFVWKTRHPRKKTKYGSGIGLYDPEVGKRYKTHNPDMKVQEYLVKEKKVK